MSHTRHLMDLFGEEGQVTFNPAGQRLIHEYFYPGIEFSSSKTESFATNVCHSQYFKPARSLLEEFVNVGNNAIDISNKNYVTKLSSCGKRGSIELSSDIKAEMCNSGHLSVQKHQLGVKITNLISLLQEIEGRYEKYSQQMEELISAFEMTAGLGSAKCYTDLALQAMTKHFCRLRDAIVLQINVSKTQFSDDLPKMSNEISQIGLFDRQKRESRMIQRQWQSWRSRRGLSEISVSILRSWLFEHFLHPYPNDSEKLMLASKTGLTKNQISNWFINARVRLWKPMIEAIYKEEFGDSLADSNQLLPNSSMTLDLED